MQESRARAAKKRARARMEAAAAVATHPIGVSWSESRSENGRVFIHISDSSSDDDDDNDGNDGVGGGSDSETEANDAIATRLRPLARSMAAARQRDGGAVKKEVTDEDNDEEEEEEELVVSDDSSEDEYEVEDEHVAEQEEEDDDDVEIVVRPSSSSSSSSSSMASAQRNRRTSQRLKRPEPSTASIVREETVGDRIIYCLDSDDDSAEEQEQQQQIQQDQVRERDPIKREVIDEQMTEDIADEPDQPYEQSNVEENDSAVESDDAALHVSPVPDAHVAPLLTPRKHPIVVRRRRLDEEHAAFLLFHGERETPSAAVLRLVIELISRGVGANAIAMQQWISYLLWCKLNTVVDRIQNHERERYSEWMKIVLGADEPPPTQVSRRRVTESLLPQPIQHTLRAVQYVLPPKTASRSSNQQRHDSSSSSLKNESKTTGKKRSSSSSWLERKAAEIQNGASRLKIDIPAGQPRRRASVGTPTSPSPVFARNAARKRKRERDADVVPGLSRRTLSYSPDVKRGRAASLQSQSDSVDYSPSTVSAVSSAPGPRRGASVPLCFDLTNDDHTSGVNRSMPVGWGPDDVQGVAPARRPAAMNPLWSMSLDDLKRHINAARVEGRAKSYEKLSDVLSKLMTHPRNRHGVFNYPVDPVAQNLPTYLEVIKRPMDFGTIKRRLDEGLYVAVDDFIADVELVFTNARTFNPPNHYIHVDAGVLLARFHEMMGGDHDRSASLKRQRQHACDVCRGNACALCEQGCLPFAQPHLQCSASCGTDIRKGSVYYITRDGTRVLCVKCRNRHVRAVEENGLMSHDSESLHGQKKGTSGGDKKKNDSKSKKKPKKSTLTEAATADAVLVHGELLKRKCDVDVEPWVKCGQCSRWLHQVCGLYNPVAGVYAADNDYVCPLCVWKQRAPSSESKTDLHSLLNPVAPPQTRSSSCQEIPSCELSDFIEDFLRRGLRDLNEHEAADSLHVRVLSFPNECVHVPEGVVQTFGANASLLEQVCESSEPRRLPREIAFTSRGIYLFQRHEGCDVCLFTLFVQEFGDDCELPSNRRSVYVAYLDSIRYLSPPSARTASYHLVMMAYFDYIRRHGFERVHIWSCPPQRRISYVFWCRPPFQKTPSAEHLRAWYKRLLTKAQDANIVQSWTTTYDRYFSTSSPLPGAAWSGSSGGVSLFDAGTHDVTCNGSSSSSSSTVATRGSTSRSVDPNELHWPAPELPPIFEGDFLPAELERILGYIAARNAKGRRASKNSGGKSSLVGSTGGKLAVGETVTRLKEDPPSAARVEIKLREVFVRCQQAVQRLRNDLLVVDLVVPERRPCDPARLVPAWWSQVPRFFGSRFMFHQLCATASYQFDSLRRAKHSTMMVLHHFFNERVCQLNVFCHECCLLITHIEHWTCVQCEPAVALCDMCHERQRRPTTSTMFSPLPPHRHAMVYQRQSE